MFAVSFTFPVQSKLTRCILFLLFIEFVDIDRFQHLLGNGCRYRNKVCLAYRSSPVCRASGKRFASPLAGAGGLFSFCYLLLIWQRADDSGAVSLPCE